MKHIRFFRAVCSVLTLALALPLLVTGCGKAAQTSTAPESTTVQPADTEQPTKSLHVVFSSDIHCTYLKEWYSVNYNVRIQHWVNTLIKEHEENPIDLLVINGDISLDYWIHGGSVLEDGNKTSKYFLNSFLSQLPKDIPVIILPGNHEQYSDEEWFSITGNHRQGYYRLNGTLFIFPDTFGGELDPDYHHDGEYIGADVTYIKEVMAENPDCDVYLVAHHFDTEKESAAFKKLVRETDRIKGLFSGHTHQTAVIQLDASWGNKTLAQTGNFSYVKNNITEEFWGFRELIITEDAAYSQYVMAESSAKINGVTTSFERTLSEQVTYYGTAPAIPEKPAKPDPLADYVTLYDKIDQSSIDGDEGVKETNRLALALDNDITTKWCVRPTATDSSVTIMWQMTEAVTLDAYAFTTANDALDRNPKAWTLYGRNSEKSEWIEISAVTDGKLPQALRTVSDVFTVNEPTAYRYYKLTLTDNCGDRSIYQFSEFIMLQKKPE